jgi:hypothetical protein
MAAHVGSLINSGQTLHSFCFKAAAAEYGNTGRVGNFQQKNYSSEAGIDGTIGLFRRNSGCSTEQKTLRIPFRTIQQRRQMLRILCHGTKIEANSRNSVLNHSAEQKTLGIPFRTVPQRRKCSESHSVESKLSEFRSKACFRQKKCCILCLLEQDFFKLLFFIPFSSVPSLGIDSSVNLGLSTFFRGIKEAIPSLFRRIFSSE